MRTRWIRAVFVLLRGGWVSVAAESESSLESTAKAETRVFYRGPVDQGGVEMWIRSSGQVTAVYKPHPQLKTKAGPWKKQLTLNVGDVAKLFALVESDKVREKACPEFPVLPGQLSRLVEVEAQGQPNPWQCQYIEPQGVLRKLDQEILAIYALVGKRGDESIDTAQ